MSMSRESRKAPPGQGAHVLASVTCGLEQFIEQHGVSADRVMARGGLDLGVSEVPTRPILMRDFCTVLDGAVRATGNDRFGLWYGRQFQPEAFGLMGYLAITSPTLGEALQNLERAFPVHQSDSYFKAQVQDGLCRIDYQLRDGSILNRSQDAELSIAMFCNILKQSLGDHWSPLEVHFEHTRPLSAKEHRKAFACEVCFDQPLNSILMRADVLKRPMPKSDPILHAVLQQALSGLSTKGMQPKTIADLVRSEIVEMLKSGYPRLEDLAGRLGMPSWTLQRRLASEGRRFKDMVDAVRRDLSLVLLSEPALSISELAFRLGYSEVSAFSRAFYRWHGLSPRDWRKRNANHPNMH